MTTTHEPHGHCRRCHTGVHRYRGDNGLGPWQHVNVAEHELDTLAHVAVDCCADHRRDHALTAVGVTADEVQATHDLGECDTCRQHLVGAVGHGRATGSVGCTYGNDDHRVKWTRP